MFETLEEAIAAYEKLQAEKDALVRKRDELLGEVRKLKDKFSKFTKYADQDDLDIEALLDIKSKYEAGETDLKGKYEAAYQRDKETFEKRLKALEQEREEERTKAQQQTEQAIAAQLKSDGIAEFSKETHRIRNPQQFWSLFGNGRVQRGEDGQLFVGDEYKKQSLKEYIQTIEEDADNQHHFKAKGGTGSGTQVGGTGSGGKPIANPWKAETRNLTEQGRITKQNPELAKRLKAEAGVK